MPQVQRFSVCLDQKELVTGDNVNPFVYIAFYVNWGVVVLAVVVAFIIFCLLAAGIIKELNKRL